MAYPEKSMSPGQIGQNYHSIKAKRSDSGSERMKSSHVALQPCNGASNAQRDELHVTAASRPSLLRPDVSQGVLSRHHAGSHDMNSRRKSRQSEEDSGGNPRKRSHHNGSQQLIEEKSGFLPLRKQFISEEKMAARMSNLSITNDNKMASLQKQWLQARLQTKRQLEEIESRLSDSESDVESDDNRATGDDTTKDHCQLHISAELKTALRQQEAFLPDSVVKSMSNVCHEIVLWKPPSSLISDVINPIQDSASKERSDGQSNDNINSAASDAVQSHTTDVSHDNTDKMTSSSTDATELFDFMDDDDMELQDLQDSNKF